MVLGRRVRREVLFYRTLLADPRTPRPARWLINAGVGYLFLPFDLIPDFVPVIGKLDDLVICSALISLGMKLVPKHVMRDNRRRTASLYSRTRYSSALQTRALPATFGVSIIGLGFPNESMPQVATRLLRLVDVYSLVVIAPGTAEPVPLPLDSMYFRSGHDYSGAALYLRSRGVTSMRFLNLDAAYLNLPQPVYRKLADLRLQLDLAGKANQEVMLRPAGRPAGVDNGVRLVSASQFVSLLLADRYQSITAASSESDDLIGNLRQYFRRETFSYRPRLRAGDVAAWNPRRVLCLGADQPGSRFQFIVPSAIAAQARASLRQTH